MSKTAFRFVFILTILSVFLFTGSAILFAEDAHTIRNGRVNTASVNVRSGPGTTYGKIGSVKKGMKLEIKEQKNGWYKVKVWKMDGWVRNDFVSTKGKVPVSQETSDTDNGSGSGDPSSGDSGTDPGNDIVTGKYLVIKESKVNVRSGAGTDFPIVAKVSASEKYEVVQRKGEWYKITISEGKQGWVAGWVTELVDAPLPSRGDTGTTRPETPENPGTPDNPGTPNQENPEKDTIKLSNISYDTSEPDRDTIVITGSGQIEYSIASLKDPSRLVIDIKNCEINGLNDIESGGTILQKIRVAQYSIFPMAVRIVLDLNKAADFVPLVSDDGTSLRVTLSQPSINGKIIVLDPGHGGWDNGATGVTGLKEKDFNLDTALRIRDNLIALGATVIMTREDDPFISLTERGRIANDAQADAFVSIHANANTNPAVKGTSTYFYALNQPEQRERLAALVQDKLAASLGTRDIGVLQANFAVLRGTNMP
ncbi:MAG TPA: N-acetylmuramoyl-L-alanine amidase, partial [Desulfobacteria bacterium]|nr:N-acetylmuramoyl-L-alanine amidase [Desulfobacteria bacterium]